MGRVGTSSFALSFLALVFLIRSKTNIIPLNRVFKSTKHSLCAVSHKETRVNILGASKKNKRLLANNV